MTTLRRSEFLALATGAASLVLGREARAQADYPSRPVELVVPSSAGGGTDVVARAFAEAAKRHSPQPFVVVNRGGAAGAIGFSEVLNARPDGYKVGVIIVALNILPYLNQIRFSADDFQTIARLNTDPAAIVVRSESPWNTIEEFIADAKRRPGSISLGDVGVGSIFHLAGAAMADLVGARFLHVPYAGSAPAVVALLGGHVDALTVSPPEAMAHIQSGRFRVLAVMADARASGVETAPTLKERGIELSIGTWRGLAVRRGTPREVVERLTVITRHTVQEQSYRDALSRGHFLQAYLEGEEFDAFIARERELFQHLVTKLQLG